MPRILFVLGGGGGGGGGGMGYNIDIGAYMVAGAWDWPGMGAKPFDA